MTEQEKQSLWHDLKQKDPKAAEWLKQLKQKFGVFELKQVKFK